MISRLNIEGFKGINELEIPKLSRVTLLGGRNNVGKSSILEALFMFHDRLNPQMILRQFAWRGVSTIALNPESIWTPVFYDYNLDRKIIISATVNGDEEKMTIKFNPKYVPASIPAIVKGQKMEAAQIRTDQKPEPSAALDIIYDSRKMKNQMAHLLIGLNGLSLQLDNVAIEGRPANFLGARVPIDHSDEAQKFGQLDIRGELEKVVNFLRIIDPKLQSLSSVNVGAGISLIHGNIGLSRKIPVAYMGDGVSRLLSFILAIANSKNGVVLIDECENGLHYSVMQKIWEAIAKAAHEYDCQVVGTTHSYECLEAAYKGISADLREDFSYVRIDRIDNKTKAKCFDYEMLNVAIETNTEVR